MCLCMALATFQVSVFAEESSQVEIVEPQLLSENNTVFGSGILTGTTDNNTADMDDKCWDLNNPNENRGYDNSVANNIVRSFDTITYNVKAGFNNLNSETHILGYQIEVDDDSEIEVTASSFTEKESSIINGKKIYKFEKTINEDKKSSGEVQYPFSIKVNNKTQGYEVNPTVYVYVDNETNNKKIDNVEPVIVTSAPMYNIVLKKGTLETNKNVYDFSKQGDCANNANGYKDNKVTGFRQVFGLALEVRKPGNGIKGVELPDPTSDFTFDIDLSDYTVDGHNATADGFVPLLYYYGSNGNKGGANVQGIPCTNVDSVNSNLIDGNKEDVACYNSGNYKMTPDADNPSIVHVTVNNFEIDYKKFPKTNYGKDTYWSNINAIREGIFSAFQFHVVYPYKKQNGETLVSKYGTNQTNANASVTVDNMYAVSTSHTTTTEETIPLKPVENTDNKQGESFTMTKPGKREQYILYTSRNSQNLTDSYYVNAGQNDKDIATVGAEDLAFTVSYSQNNVGEADEASTIPLAIEQMVLFDRDALSLNGENLQVNTSQDGYSCKYYYLTHKDGKKLTDETMRNATLEDFNISETPSDDCDGVLVRYQGCYTRSESSSMLQATRFWCNVKPQYDLSDKVYMVTATTKTWTAADLTDDEKNSLLANSGKQSFDELTREDYSNWVKDNQNLNLFNRDRNNENNSLRTIDHRNEYTIPDYDNSQYSPSSNHKFNMSWADALYLVPYTVSIGKKTAQTENGELKQQYNVSKKQRYVDYVVTSSIHFANDVTPDKDAKTTVYYKDTLPKGLSYVSDSSYLGGTYKSDLPNKGTVTNGKKLDPVVTHNQDGTTTLEWTVTDVSLNKSELTPIHYSCKIGDENDPANDVDEKEPLKNNISIQTDEDKREPLAQNDNIASYSINVIKEKEFYLAKTGKDSLELNDNGYFNLQITNTSDGDKKDLLAVDTMPQDDIDGTIMKGNYKLTKVSINKKLLKNHKDFKLYYTNSSQYKGKKANEISQNDLSSQDFKEAIQTESGDYVIFKGDGLIDSWPTAIVYTDDNLAKDSIANIRLEYEANGAEKDHLVNTLSVSSENRYLHDEAEVDVVKRSLEGTVWFDKNKDGKLGPEEDGETRFKNVKVTILKKNEDGSYSEFTPYTETVDGKTKTYDTTITTDENGHYKFDGLPEGEFKVVFESVKGSDNYKDISHYDVTKAKQGKDEESSKVLKDNVKKDEQNNDELISGSILDIKMPSKEEMISTNQHEYNLPNQNLGLTVPSITISGTKTWDDQNNYDGLRPDSITLQIKNGDTVVKEIKVKESDNWNWSAELPKYDDDMNEIQYIVSEKKVEGYESTVNGYNVTNTHTVTPLTIPVTKVWNDNDNNDKIRPEKVIVHLYEDGKDTNKTVELSEDNQWHASFENLNQYKDGKKIIYTVEEDEVKDYKVGITGSQDTGYVLINTHGNETVEVKGTKTWDDKNDQDKIRPTKITIRLLADGKEIAVKEVTKETDWTYDFGNLAKYKDGKEIVYTISEDEVEGYKTSIKGFNITNSHIPTTPSKPSTDTPSKDDQNPKGDQPSMETPKGDQSSKNEQPTNGQTPVVKGETKTTSKEQTNKIKTGDDTHLILYVLFVVVSFMGILFLKKKAHN